MRMLLATLLLSSVAFAQNATPPAATPMHPPAQQSGAAPSSATQPATPEGQGVAPNDAVLTIQGFCPDKPGSTAADCKTVVTRAEFEKLADALNPNMPDATKRQLAAGLAQMMVLSSLAEQRGIDKKPATQEVLRFARMQTLAQLFFRTVQQEASNVAPADLQAYYDQHKDQFAQATLQRLFIPKSSPEPDKKMDEAAIKAEATKIHAAAGAANADFAKLQQQAYTDLGLKSTPPPVEMKDVRRDNIPPGQSKAFDLAEGQVSEPMDEPGGYYIYKLVSKKTPPLSEMDAEIRRTLEQTRMKEEMDALTAKVKPDLNDAYFGAPASPHAGVPGGPAGMQMDGATKTPPAASNVPASKVPATTAPKTAAPKSTPKKPK